jgi:hypothetical protein
MPKFFAVVAILFVSFLTFRLLEHHAKHAAFLADPVQVQEANEAREFWALACERSKFRTGRIDRALVCNP